VGEAVNFKITKIPSIFVYSLESIWQNTQNW